MCHSLIMFYNFYYNSMLQVTPTVFKSEETESQIICPNPHDYALAE